MFLANKSVVNFGLDVPDLPEDPKILNKIRDAWSGELIAWDPVQQKAAWKQPYISAGNGGTLATAGNLVFQGTADGRVVAYRADTGEQLWEASGQLRGHGRARHLTPSMASNTWRSQWVGAGSFRC